jgi:PmbA protein
MSAHKTDATVRELCAQAEKVVGLCRAAGADAAEVLVSDGSELTVKVRLGQPELVQEAGSRALGLRVFKDGRRAVTYTSDLRDGALAAFVAESVALATLSEPDEFAAAPDPSELATSYPDLDLYDPAVAEVDAAWGLARCVAGEAAARAADPRITNSDGATFSRSASASAFATSGGFVGGYRGSYASLVVEPIADDTSETTPKKRNGYWWTADRFLARLEDPRRSAARRPAAPWRSSARARSRPRSARSCSRPRSRARWSAPCTRWPTAPRSGARPPTCSAARAR